MSGFTLTRFIIAIAAITLLLAILLGRKAKHGNALSIKFIAKSGVFAAFSIILYIVPALNINLPIFPSFLKLHFDEIPAFIAGFAYGPFSALLVIIVKTLVKLPMTNTLGVGELADFIYSCAFVLPAAIIYRKKKNVKGAIAGFGISTIIQLIVSCFLTTFVILKFYIFVMGWSEGFILSACQIVNPAITDLKWPFFFIVALPFNALKDVIVVILTFLLYKRLHKFIDRISAQKN